jgi:hypothetical protein
MKLNMARHVVMRFIGSWTPVNLRWRIMLLLMLASSMLLEAETVFENLDFEAAHDLPTNPQVIGLTPFRAFPWWSPHIGDEGARLVSYNSFFYSFALFDNPTNSEDRFQIGLRGTWIPQLAPLPPLFVESTLEQTGTVPVTAKTLIVSARGLPPRIEMGTNSVPLRQKEVISDGNIVYAGDISRWAGQTLDLKLIGGDNPVVISSIEFSSQLTCALQFTYTNYQEQVEWPSVKGWRYTLQASFDLKKWDDLRTLIGTGEALKLGPGDIGGILLDYHFFRVQAISL